MLVPCGECRRHVASAEAACPFCGTAREAKNLASARLGRVSRAAVFAGAALASAACGGKKPKAEPASSGSAGARSEAEAERRLTDNQQTQTAPADAAVPVESVPIDNSNIPMPYGAPPVRRRVV